MEPGAVHCPLVAVMFAVKFPENGGINIAVHTPDSELPQPLASSA
jgi:hypothetical protein